MTVPLSQFLTRFSATPGASAAPASPSAAPMLVLSQDELDARIAAVTDALHGEMAAQHQSELDALVAGQTISTAETLATARADWVAGEAIPLAEKLDAGLAALRLELSDRVEAVLRPFLVEAILARATRELGDALDRLLADADVRPIAVRGPADLIAGLRAARPTPGIEWIEDERVDVTIVTDTTRIETRLAAALRALDAKES